MKRKRLFAFTIDIWDDVGGEIIEHIAGVDDFEDATATYSAAVKRWPAARVSCDKTRASCAIPGQRNSVNTAKTLCEFPSVPIYPLVEGSA
jgi:hypothetical protein